MIKWLIKVISPKRGFYFILILSMLPLLVIPLKSMYFHSIDNAPSIQNDITDVKGFNNIYNREIPLDGEWKFSWNRRNITENDNNDMFYNKHLIFSAVYIGILVTLIGGYVLIYFMEDKKIHLLALLAINIIIFVRVIFRDDFYSSLTIIAPFLNYHMFKAVGQILALYLPAIIMICAKDFFDIDIKKDIVIKIVIFEFVCGLLIYFCIIFGLQYLEGIFSIVSFIPYIFILHKFYQFIKQEIPYALNVSVVVMLIFSALVMDSFSLYGLLIVDVSLYMPTYFVLAMIIQYAMYVRMSNKTKAEALEAAVLRLELKDSQMNLMMSQIQPHFMYNALIAIQVLCIQEPETAEVAIHHFSKYLRANMQSFTKKEPIPFLRELDHIKNYAAIELLRFKNRLTIIYDIKETDFSVPALTIQPIVENAIKHGACKKITGGEVTIKTYSTETCYCVEVVDDGPGFDISVLKCKDKDSYGLKNIRFRLESMMCANIEIHSQLDYGTRVFIQIPK